MRVLVRIIGLEQVTLVQVMKNSVRGLSLSNFPAVIFSLRIPISVITERNLTSKQLLKIDAPVSATN